ncbi:LPXTG cell wall anchor domain-containing protein [Alkaliphilus sp. MSJ-5]|uniref:LPXTG cell wall anchor domain-containing protein n=1 Tax=Alkaliphilus flagellatus TaxID=2841507 RepID=A0ABS6G279_9FIRM|nr:collagen binding domain-containing protein [Alkaliphilus flagellatus]MBU5675763.1 LPXTG cell wall anchor domain-containing protein [Alkaliphilus flagellatus]
MIFQKSRKKRRISGFMILVMLLTVMSGVFTEGFLAYANEGDTDLVEVSGEVVSTENNEDDNTAQEPEDLEELELDENEENIEGSEEDTETIPEDEIEEVAPEDETEEVTPEEGTTEEIEEPILFPIIPMGEATEDPKDLGDIFTFKSLKVGEEEFDENSQSIIIEKDIIVKLEYGWEIESGVAVNSGDTASIKVPQAFKFPKDFNGNITVDTVDGKTIVGTFNLSAETNILEFVFNDEIASSGVKNGVVGFGVEFNLEKFNESTIQKIEFNDKANKELTITLKPKEEATAITKAGEPDSKQDAKEITWTIDVINTENSKITDAKVEDIIPDGLKLPTEIKIYPLTLGYNGSKNIGVERYISPTVDGRSITVDLGEIESYSGYRIEFTTEIEDYSKTSFENTAEFSYDGSGPLEATSTPVKIIRSKLIEKDGNQDGEKDIIEWTIDVNKAGRNITDAIVEDVLPEGLTLIEDSIKIYELTKNGENWIETDVTSEFDSGDVSDISNIELGNIGTKAYRIKFKTDIDYSKVNNGNYEKDGNSFTNKVILKDGSAEIDSSEKKVYVARKPILRKEGRSAEKYDDKTITWTIHVNEARHPITGGRVTDEIPAGLKLNKDNIKIFKNNTEVNEGYTITTNPEEPTGKEDTTLTINLGNIGKDYYKIVYVTEITDFTEGKIFKNEACLTGDGVGNGGTIPPVPVKPKDNSYKKEFVSTDYEAKTIRWRITIDPIKDPITNLKIIDTFPNKGLILLEDTLKVEPGLEKDADYTLKPLTEDSVTGYQKGFEIEFKEKALPLNKKITITYKTSFDPEKGIEDNTANGLYENKAQFIGTTKSGEDIEKDSKDSTTVNTESWFSGKKEGKRIHEGEEGRTNGWISGKERKLQWEVYINYLKQNLGSSVTVTDTWEYDGLLDEDSIEVRQYKVNPNGTTEILNDCLVKGEDYTVSSNEDKKEFILTFNKEVKERYVIIYITSVDGKSKNEYMNRAEVKIGEQSSTYAGTVAYSEYDELLSKEAINVNGTKVYTDDELNWEIIINRSLSEIENAKVVDTISPGLVYVVDSLKVYKIVGEEEVILTNGYTLETENNDLNETILTIEFQDKIDSKYVIRYSTVVSAETGEVNNKVSFSGSEEIEEIIETTKLSARQFSWVGGEIDPNKGNIKLIKIDGDSPNEKIKDAEFQLYYYLNGEKKLVGEPIKTDADGVILFQNLSFRTYFLEEVNPPEGYQALEKPIEIKLDKEEVSEDYDNNTRTKTLEVKNYKLGSLAIKKVDSKDETKVLAGAEFKLNNTETNKEYILITDDNGSAKQENLPQGTYTLRETKPPKGYKLDSKTRTIVISGSDEEDKELHIDLSISNIKTPPQPILGGLSIKKVDSKNSTIVLSGAEFELKDSKGEVVAVLTTDENGVDTVTGLPLGKYTLAETKAPRRYDLDETIHKITISSSITVNLVLENIKTPTTPGGEEPDKPDKPDKPNRPTEPTNPTKPTEPVEPQEYVEPEEPETPVIEETPVDDGVEVPDDGIPLGTITDFETEKLPQTGEGSPLMMYLAGLLLIILGWVTIRKKAAQ